MAPTWIAALGAVGLFLLGMVVLQRGLEGLAGGRLGEWLARRTKSPSSGALTGFLLTTAMQSSSATTLTTVGLVGAGMLTFAQALGVVLGANVGSTTTGWLVALLGFKLDLGHAAELLVFVGVALHLFTRERSRHGGFALAGFGLLLVGIGALQGALAGLEGEVTPQSLPSGGLGARAALIGVGCLVTLVTQSSGAGVAAVMAAVVAGAVSMEQALGMVIGMDVGTTGTAMLAALGGTSGMRRTALAHVLFNVFTAFLAFWSVDVYLTTVDWLAPSAVDTHPAIVIAGFQTSFNLLGVAIVLPQARRFARLLLRLVPEREERLVRGLERKLVAQPSIALHAAGRVLERVARRTLRESLRAVNPRATRSRTRPSLGELAAAVERTLQYLASIPIGENEPALFARATALVHQADHLERLLHRLGAVPAGMEFDQGATFESQRAELERALHLTLRTTGGDGAPRDQSSVFDPAALASVHSALRSADEEQRQAVLRRAASGDTTPEAAILALDRQRWLRRVALHVWRITHYAHLARGQA